MPTTKFHVSGMHCSSCKLLLEDVCKDISGITACEVDHASSTMVVTHEDLFDTSLVKKEVEALGGYNIERIV
jgi:copper chaperone CopZ